MSEKKSKKKVVKKATKAEKKPTKKIAKKVIEKKAVKKLVKETVNSGKKILYVEDNKDTAGAVKIILEGVGFEVDLAYNGKSGLRAAKKAHDLVLLDIMLPDMSGWDIFEKIKKGKHKIVFLSAIPVSKERIRELKKVGVSDYITKPFAKADLIKRVKKILK